MIEVHKVRHLNLREAIQSGRSAFLSAASGLVREGTFLYVVADDENHLAVFPADGEGPGEVLRIFNGELPTEKRDRKKTKPDLEALTFLPALFYPPYGALFAVPSGSKPQRCTGAFIPLDAAGAVAGEPVVVDLRHAYAFFEAQCGPLNLEGATVCGPNLYLVNRGNKKRRTNALIVLDLRVFLRSVQTAAPLSDTSSFRSYPLDFGDLGGVPLTPTDVTTVDTEHLAFTAAAEATDSSYEDGSCHGSAVGVMDLTGRVLLLELVSTSKKLEGISVRRDGDRLVLDLVNDEDSDASASELLRAYLPLIAVPTLEA